MSPPMERIQILEAIEKDIITCLQSAGQAFMELSKDKSNSKQAEGQTHQFIKTLGLVESKLSEQINYLTQVSTGQPHEGSGYESQKVLQMAWHRLQHVRSRVDELERIKNKHLHSRNLANLGRSQQSQQQQQQQQQQQMASNNISVQQPQTNSSAS
ncbi:PREDICTED: mediator of RNA polymerase II transcription subunit 11 [Ceratosolen solmsi marchali]|uniref:Mediator of RNA polymerase II transcription subunit 11 n=1 Tax=Ceratosolen solmsi marchali TaxID=326594 RepID=A0AAJ6YD08_9HYME|nr:PREDICTED: mediator of RNA polymerase II transcription subunit 11 [Ceratosolen solmsi marchali]XP_011495798.1 PREDICTED: mediator of RNA polymerase II transcription subunit 11 [Ceratosolen solmsi marchali]